MSDTAKYVVELRGVAVYHNINPFKELTLKNYRTDGERVLDSLNLCVNAGELVYLIGRTGSGKSSLLKTLYGELPLFDGSGTVVGFDLKNLKPKQISELRRNIGIVMSLKILPLFLRQQIGKMRRRLVLAWLRCCVRLVLRICITRCRLSSLVVSVSDL